LTASPRPRPLEMRLNPRLIGVLVWAAGTLVVAFFLVLGANLAPMKEEKRLTFHSQEQRNSYKNIK